jgi:uncharacterized protein (DUF488 family)
MDLFTIGYEGMTIDSFIQHLLRWRIDTVADVRLNPISRKPSFSKRMLAQALATHKIQYFHFRELGTPKAIRDEVRDTGDYARFIISYKKFVVTKVSALEELNLLIRSRRVVLMCLEKDPEKCHRSVLASVIRDINGDGLSVHAL